MEKPVTLEQVIDFLLRTPLFNDLDANELSDVVRIMQVQRVRDGSRVFSEGDEGDGWYVVFRGEVLVTRSTPFGPARTVAALGPQSIFGEMAILDGSPRSATVRSRGDTTLFRFPREPFDSLVSEVSPGAFKLIYGMAQVLCQRQRQLTQQLSDLLTEGAIEKRAAQVHLGHVLDKYSVSE